MGEWAFYAAALLMALALIKRVPYNWLASTYTLIAVAYWRSSHMAWCCSISASGPSRLLSTMAGISLRVLIDHQDGFLTGERLCKLVPHWKSASMWFCGRAAFGQALHGDLVENGLTTSHFHRKCSICDWQRRRLLRLNQRANQSISLEKPMV